MRSATVEPQTEKPERSASMRRPIRFRPGMWIAVGVVFAAQVALLFWLRTPPAPPAPPVDAAPAIDMHVKGSEELLALQDPTMFILPHRENFSGAGWLKEPRMKFTPTNWTEPPRPLPLRPQQLGETFTAFMQTNLPPRFQPKLASELDMFAADRAPMQSISTPSTLRIAGDLAKLRLLTPLHLPPQTDSNLLSDTVVQVLVDAEGRPFSQVLLASSGNGNADQMALTNFAKAVRFAPPQAAGLGTVPQDKMTLGKLIFEWQTVPPPPSTNAPPAHQ